MPGITLENSSACYSIDSYQETLLLEYVEFR